DQHVIGRAELLQLDLAQAEGVEIAAQHREIRRLRRLDLDGDAALEVHAVVQAGMEEQDHRGDAEERRGREADDPAPHELDLGVVRDETEPKHHAFLSTGRTVGRLRRIQATIMKRTSTIAVNIEVRMPIAVVTAKPRTGPELREYRIAILISEVTLASKIVPK